MDAMDFQEGYADGLAGAGMQMRRRPVHHMDWQHVSAIKEYEDGFKLSSLDRKAMPARDPFDQWMEGLG